MGDKMNNTVQVDEGLLSGVCSSDDAVRVFKGIPFAKPPVGDLRWRAPQPVEPWEGVRRAETFSPICPQPLVPEDSILFFVHEEQSEDCLYLNVWTGADSDKERRPVMVWFHLGAYQFGSASLPLYDGEQLARAGVILVTANYRFGRLGFLAHPDLTKESGYNASGNYGLLDQIAALRWVKANIAAFGGDPDCVTIFGVSAGSYSVCCLMASPLAKDLFHRVIGQSGGFFGAVHESARIGDGMMQDLAGAERTGLKIAKAMGAGSIAELRAKSAEEVLKEQLAGWADEGFDVANINREMFDCAQPTVDGYAFPDSIYEIFSQGQQNDVPLMTGSNAKEATCMPHIAKTKTFIEDSRVEYGDMVDEFLRLYPADTDEQALESSSAANGDRIFVWQNFTWARLQSRTGRSPKTFYYHFSRVPPFPTDAKYLERDPAPLLGAFHSAEIPYLFRHLNVRDWPWLSADYKLSEVMSSYWMNFAKTGDPNGPGLPDWPAFSEKAPKVMHFGDEIKIGPVPNKEKLDFWDAYYEKDRAVR